MFEFFKKFSKVNTIIYLSIIGAVVLFLLVGDAFNNNKKVTSLFKQPTSYNDLYSLINNLDNNINYFSDKSVYDESTNVATTSSGKNDYSDTNLQVLGVQEADIIKTDGNYIYALSSENLYIIEANNGELTLLSTTKHYETTDEKNTSFSEIYISGNKLIAIKNTNTYYKFTSSKDSNTIIDWQWYGHSEVGVVVFDITNKTSPTKLGEVSQSGYYLSSRMIGNYLYLVSNYYVYNDDYKTDDISNYVPYVDEDKITYIGVKDIYIAPNSKSSQYVIVTGLDINSPDSFISKKSIFGSGSDIYTSLDNLYVVSYDSIEEDGYYKTKTNLLKFSLNNGIVDMTATGSVYGTILNQYSMDEYNDTFRIVTTSYDYKIEDSTTDTSTSTWNDDYKNNLYILDDKLNSLGKIENLAKGEQVYSVRFDESIVYFVTYEQVDPLFAVDLTNPTSPTILSELKIPGFSEYLHVYNDNYLFGLGKETTDGTVTGMKISMFDITDKGNITEKYKLSLGSEYTWSEASYDYKSILVSLSKNIIAFPANNSYLVFSFNETDGFTKIGEIKFDDNYWFSSLRGLYINDYFYIFNGYELRSYNISDFTNIKNLTLEELKDDVIYEETKETYE